MDGHRIFGLGGEIGDLGRRGLFRKNSSATSAMPEENQGGNGKKRDSKKFKNLC